MFPSRNKFVWAKVEWEMQTIRVEKIIKKQLKSFSIFGKDFAKGTNWK